MGRYNGDGVTMTTRAKVYLSGPVELSDDPQSWREEVKEDIGYFSYIDPLELGLTSDDSPYEVTWKCLDNLKLADIMFINYIHEEPTWGTPIESYYAWQDNIPVVVWTEMDFDELPMFLQTFALMASEDKWECLSAGERNK